jgi:hypothetical protein
MLACPHGPALKVGDKRAWPDNRRWEARSSAMLTVVGALGVYTTRPSVVFVIRFRRSARADRYGLLRWMSGMVWSQMHMITIVS